MSLSSTPAPGPVVEYGGPGRDDLTVLASAGVDAGVAVALYMRSPDDTTVSFLFGKERFTLEFFDVESLERLRDLADEAARRLRAAFEMNTRAKSTTDSAVNR